MSGAKTTLAVFKFASCDGCQLSLLDCEDELLDLASALDIVYFPEASSDMQPGPYDIALVEGSITTASDRDRIVHIRESSKRLITIGACATSGGIQALRNFQNVDDYINLVYAHPEYISTLETSTGIADHVDVDFELRGCPVNKQQLVETLAAFLAGRTPQIRETSVCVECKSKHNTCLLIVSNTPCLGPVTQSGCGALCPSYNRGCYGCYGPKENANPAALTETLINAGNPVEDIVRLYKNFNADSEPFRRESQRLENGLVPHDNQGN